MTTKLNHPEAPPEQLLLTAEMRIEAKAVDAASPDGAQQLPRFHMVAYSGGVMRLAGWKHPVVVDLAGMNIPSQTRPIRVGHNSDKRVGHTSAIRVADDILTTRFNRLSGVDDTLRAEFRALAPAEKRLAVELGEGVQVALRRYPEDGLALIQKMDAGGLAQARTYGDFVLDGAHWLHSDDVAKALGAAKLGPDEATALSRALGLNLKTLPETLQPEHVAPLWKSVIRKTGDGSAVFWKTYIQPHKGKWLAGGLLATYLIMPEKFHDAAGNLTEYATRQLAELGIAVSSGVVRGTIWGPIAAFKARYADDPATTILAAVLIVSLLLLAIPPIRRFAWRCLIRPIWGGSTAPANTAPGFTSHEPFRE